MYLLPDSQIQILTYSSISVNKYLFVNRILCLRKHWPNRVRMNSVSHALQSQMQFYSESLPKQSNFSKTQKSTAPPFPAPAMTLFSDSIKTFVFGSSRDVALISCLPASTSFLKLTGLQIISFQEDLIEFDTRMTRGGQGSHVPFNHPRDGTAREGSGLRALARRSRTMRQNIPDNCA